MLANKMPVIPKFLDEPAEESDKILWKYAYATYLLTIEKSPQEAKTKKINLSALLPILASREQRWYAVELEMMKTSHKLIQRMNVFLNRYKEKVMEVSVLMQEIREHQDQSAEIDQTFNRSKTDSERSDEDQQKVEPSELGLKNEHSAFEDPEEEVKVEETTVNPLEQAPVHEPDEAQNLLQEQVHVQVQIEDDSVLQKRKRNVEQMTDSDMSLFGADIAAFLNAKKTRKRAKTGLKEAKAAYDKACADLEDLRANFNAAFESSAENQD